MSTLDVPTRLPVDALSVSSINLFRRCPEKWRRRYVEREYEPPRAPMILGSAVGAAENHADQVLIDTGSRVSTDDVLDLYMDEFEERTTKEEVDWEGEQPGGVKDIGIQVIRAYEEEIVPTYTPVSVEREFYIQPEGVEWGFKGFLDLELDNGVVADRKVIGKKMNAEDAAKDTQATAYLLARRTEGNPAIAFDFHTTVKTKKPYAEILSTTRTDKQLDAFVELLYKIAAEMHWRLENDAWGYAPPGGWWCSEKQCGFWRSCPMGGAL